MSGWRSAGLAAQFGLIVAGLVLGGAWLGHLVGGVFGGGGAFLVAGILSGLSCSFYLIYLLYRLEVKR